MITILANLLKPVVIPMGVSEADLLYYLNAVSGYLTALLGAAGAGCGRDGWSSKDKERLESVCKNPVGTGFSGSSSHNRKSNLLWTVVQQYFRFFKASEGSNWLMMCGTEPGNN